MALPRLSGILLHPTSLPDGHGVGDLGPAAIEFLDFLESAGQGLWQMLPLGPTGFGNSPYQTLSAFAGNPLLISLDWLAEEGLLERPALRRAPAFRQGATDYRAASDFKREMLGQACECFERSAAARQGADFEQFCAAPGRWWLEDFAAFTALRNRHGLVEWAKWEPRYRDREPAAMEALSKTEQREFRKARFEQWIFFRQWDRLRQEARRRDVRIMGDLPIYVACDSAEVWCARKFWHVDARDGHVTLQAGVEPDYFSATGQLWGNPIYRWDVMKQDGYQWWIERFRAAFAMSDWVRLDHFRGFDNYWAVPGGETTARNGSVLKGPGRDLFDSVKQKLGLGELPIIAENLGNIGEAVERLRAELQIPGMAILQFAFGSDPGDALAKSYRPHNYPREIVAYTGTHDNDTTTGWWVNANPETREHALRYLGLAGGAEIHWSFIRALMAAVASVIVVPMQDVLGLGSEARMNAPATDRGNWLWRLKSGDLHRPEVSERLRGMVELYDRAGPARKNS